MVNGARSTCLLILLVLFGAGLLTGCVNGPVRQSDQIDALKASPDNFKLLLENENVRVLEYVLRPGEKDIWHTHPPKSSYVVSGGQLKIYLENGETFLADEQAGTASWMKALGKHYVENVGNTEVKVILTEVKSAAK